MTIAEDLTLLVVIIAAVTYRDNRHKKKEQTVQCKVKDAIAMKD